MVSSVLPKLDYCNALLSGIKFINNKKSNGLSLDQLYK